MNIFFIFQLQKSIEFELNIIFNLEKIVLEQIIGFFQLHNL